MIFLWNVMFIINKSCDVLVFLRLEKSLHVFLQRFKFLSRECFLVEYAQNLVLRKGWVLGLIWVR